MRFEKVSYEQYANSREGVDERVIRTEYDGIKLPKRATTGSAGYDFFSPIEFELRVGDTIKIPTGIKVLLDDDKFLAIYPRSGLGFKYRIQLDNTVGIIDSDYSQSDNEGHIFIKLTNDGKANKSININSGDAIAQGIIQQYFVTENDDTTGRRNGGFGSTDKS